MSKFYCQLRYQSDEIFESVKGLIGDKIIIIIIIVIIIIKIIIIK